MRFAYIDSQGKEVGIPSVEALQLRIELGAITGDTMFYDENADKWAPAGEHEIYRSLAREAEGRSDGGFVAAPPSMLRLRMPKMDEPAEPEAPAPQPPAPQPPAAAPPTAPPPAPPAAEPPAAMPPPAAQPPAATPPPPPAPAAPEPPPPAPAPPPEPVAPAAGGDDFDLGDFGTFQLAEDVGAPEEPAEPAAAGAAPGGEAADVDLGGFGSFDMAEDVGEPAPAASTPDEGAGDAGGFDFGDMGALELEAPPEVEEPEPAVETPAAGQPPHMMGGMPMETPLSEYTPDEDTSFADEMSGGLELEDAATAAYGEAPAAPEPERPATPPAGAVDRGGDRGGDRGEGPGDRPRPSRPPRARPAPRPRKKKSPVGAIVGVVVVVGVVGGGGYFGWKTFAGGPSDVPPQDSVLIDPISSDLQPRFLQLSSEAYEVMLDSLRARVAAASLPEAPSRDWLQGRYLASASQYEGLEQYWLAVEGVLNDLRDADVDGSLFLDAYDERLAATFPVDPEIQDTLRVRGQQGYQAARRDRALVYDQLQAVIDASLDLHDLLVNNEDNIDYEPASGISRDPVTEAVPVTQALGEQMWDGVDAIQKALGELDALGEVTTTNVMNAVFERLRVTPIR